MNAVVATGTATVHAIKVAKNGLKLTYCGAETVRTPRRGTYIKPLREVHDAVTCKSCKRLAPASVPVVVPVADLDAALATVTNDTQVIAESEVFETLALGIWEQMPMF